MKQKIQPNQYDPFPIRTPSGNLLFEQGDVYFNALLLPNLSGHFNITGSLTVNGGLVNFSNATNAVGSSNIVINSDNCFLTGTKNLILNSDGSEGSGVGNLILGGGNSQVANADYTVVFGRNSLAIHTGAIIMGDADNSREKRTTQHQSLTIDFSSGAFIKNNLYVNGGVYLTGAGGVSIARGGLYLDANNSGLFSGNINVLGTAYHTGSPLQNLQNLRDASGSLKTLLTNGSGHLVAFSTGISGALSSRLELTGASFVSLNLTTSGALRTDINATHNFSIWTTGVQTAAGVKTFSNELIFLAGITGTNITMSGNLVMAKGKTVPATSTAAGTSGQFVVDRQFLYVCTGTNLWGRVAVANF